MEIWSGFESYLRLDVDIRRVGIFRKDFQNFKIFHNRIRFFSTLKNTNISRKFFHTSLQWYAGHYSEFGRRSHFQVHTLIYYLGKTVEKIRVVRKSPAVKVSLPAYII
jgi:hypothetical protein